MFKTLSLSVSWISIINQSSASDFPLQPISCWLRLRRPMEGRGSGQSRTEGSEEMRGREGWASRGLSDYLIIRLKQAIKLEIPPFFTLTRVLNE